MNGYLEICVLQIDGSKEIPLSDGKEQRGDCLHLERGEANKTVQVREVDHGSPASRHLFHKEKATVEAGTQIEDNFQGVLGQHLLDLIGATPVTEEIPPSTSETIPGSERGEEESPGSGCDNRPARRTTPRNSLQLTASASSAPTDSPPLATEAKPRQLFPGPFSFTPGVVRAAKGPRKGRLSLGLRLFFPQWEEEGVVEACCCDRETTGETPLRSAEADEEEPALDGPAEPLPRNLRRMQRPLNKSVVRSRTHLGQGRVQQGRQKNSRRRGKVCIA